MFVCVCNGITERQIRTAIEQGASSVHDLSAALGVAAGCGCCAEYAASLISQTRADQADRCTAAIPA